MKILSFLFTTSIFALCFTSCGGGSYTGGNAQGGGYLPYEVADPTSLGGRDTDDSPITDSTSHWEGDGVKGTAKVVIDISDQRAYFHKGNQLVGVSKISSGMDGHDTPTGTFKVTQKSKDHESNLYGKYVYPSGQVALAEVDVTRDKQPAGTKFDGADMPYFMRFHNGVGLHAGYLPGFAASHGCVRMPKEMARIYFANVNIGTQVVVQR